MTERRTNHPRVTYRTSSGIIEEGFFHEWGLKKIPLDNGLYINETYGIVETKSGQITLVTPTDIKFVD